METTQNQGRTEAPQTASSQAEAQERAALRAQGLKKRNDEEIAHIALAPKVLPETPEQLRLRQEKDKELARIDPSKA